MSTGGAQFKSFGPFSDTSGTLITSIQVYHYAAGTTTDKDAWVDEVKSSTIAQPIQSDSTGLAKGYFDGDYHIQIVDTSTNQAIHDWDNVRITQDTATLWEGNHGTASPSALTSNRWQLFAKHTAGNVFQGLQINDGTSFINISGGQLDEYTLTGLPTAGHKGRIALVSDDIRGLWIDTGTQWIPYQTDWVNVKYFGAAGDDTQDDTSYIQAAIDAMAAGEFGEGGIVYFPTGIYKTTAKITRASTRFNLTLMGSGYNSTLIRSESGLGTDFTFEIGDTSAALQFTRFIGLGIDCESSTGGCVKGLNVRNFQFRDCFFTAPNLSGDTTRGIFVDQDSAGAPFSGYINIDHCTFERFKVAIEADNVTTASHITYSKISGGSVAGSRGIALLNSNVAGWHVSFNQFEGFTEGAIYTKGQQSNYSLNRFESNTDYHIKFDGDETVNTRSMVFANKYIGAVTNTIVFPGGNTTNAAAYGIYMVDNDLGFDAPNSDLICRTAEPTTLKVGTSASKASIGNILSGTLAVTGPVTVAANSSNTYTVTLTGATVSHMAIASYDQIVSTALVVHATVTAVSTVTVTIQNLSASGVTMTGDGTIRVMTFALT